MRLLIRILTIYVLFTQAVAADAPAGKYVPKGMHEYTYYTLDNGIGVMLNPNDTIPTVSLRVVVQMGSWYFPNYRQETAHILEHMLFMGTSKHNETQLEDAVQFNGGSWNAQTNAFTTDYHMSIHAERLKKGIDLFYEIFSDSTFTKESFDKTLSVIGRERGPEISSLRRWMYEHELIYSADDVLFKQMYEGIDHVLPLRVYSEIRYEDVLQAFKDYYVPENYLVIAAGDFSEKEIKRYLDDTFGKLPPRKSKPHLETGFVIPDHIVIGEGRFVPLIGNTSTVKHYYPTVMADDVENNALLEIITEYLNDVLYKKLRVENALSYTPTVVSYSDQGRGYLYVNFDANVDDYEKVIAVFNPLVERLAQGDKELLENLEKYRMKYLLQVSQFDYTSEEIAAWYAHRAHDIKRTGKVYHDSYWVEQADVKKIPALVKQVFLDQNFYISKSKPTISITTAYVMLGVVLLVGVVFLIIFIRHHSLKLIRKD